MLAHRFQGLKLIFAGINGAGDGVFFLLGAEVSGEQAAGGGRTGRGWWAGRVASCQGSVFREEDSPTVADISRKRVRGKVSSGICQAAPRE